METLSKAINEKRNIKPNSLKAYLISIKKLNQFVTKKEFKDLDFLKEIDQVDVYLRKLKLATQKNYLASVIVSLDAMNNEERYTELLADYRQLLEDINVKFAEDYENGQKSKKQKENWVTIKELTKVMNSYLTDIKDRGLLKLDFLNKKQMALLQKWVIANLFLNKENPPTRLDYDMEIISKSEFNKLDEEEKKENNYLVITSRNNKMFSFNEYKTSGKYGQNNIKVGKKLNSVLNIWLKYNKTDSLLLNSQGNPLSSNGLGKELKKTFEPTGKNISVNMLRHIYISEKYPNQNDQKNKDAKLMGHSVEMQSQYSKK